VEGLKKPFEKYQARSQKLTSLTLRPDNYPTPFITQSKESKFPYFFEIFSFQKGKKGLEGRKSTIKGDG
jgi:hypothetical protein